jgi:hypothetical protein
MGNLDLYEKVKKVPENAKKTIKGGRLNGMTDINPIWRIKTLTEEFGICGVGWKYEITDVMFRPGADGNESCFVQINLYVRHAGEWSAAIPGVGGSAFIAKESSGLHTSDECVKMALTDAISVACKALLFGADVYWEADKSKYDDKPSDSVQGKPDGIESKITQKQVDELIAMCIDVTSGKIIESEKLRLQSIYKKFGYAKASEIKQKDFAKISEEMGGLPFNTEI